MPAQSEELRDSAVPIGQRLPAVALAWLIPGAGHLLLKRTRRPVLLMGSITVMFLFGIFMRGSFFTPQSGDLLTILINYGGFLGDLASGILYLLAAAFNYNQPDMAGHVYDYGTKFLV